MPWKAVLARSFGDGRVCLSLDTSEKHFCPNESKNKYKTNLSCVFIMMSQIK